MKNKEALLLRFILTFIVLYSVGTFFSFGPRYIGKDFLESADFKQTETNFLYGLNRYVLNPIDEEKTKKNITVTQDEIEYYRNYYGSEANQISNVNAQYEEKIQEAKNVEHPNQDLINSLIAERDHKIEEIRKNFSSDEVVMSKIKALKEQALTNFLEDYNTNKKSFLNKFSFFGYSFINIKTKEEHKKEINDGSIYRKKKTIVPNNEEYSYNVEYIGNYVEEVGLLDMDLNIAFQEDTYEGEYFLSKDYIAKSGLEWEYRSFNIAKWMYYAFWAIGMLSFILLLTKFKWTKELIEEMNAYDEYVKKMPIDVHAVLTSLLFVFTISSFDTQSYLIDRIVYMGSNSLSLRFVFGLLARFLVKVALLAVLIYLISMIVKRIREEKLIDLWKESFINRFIGIWQNLFLNFSIGVQTLAMFIVFFLGGFGLYIGLMGTEYFALYSALFIFILIPTAIMYFWRMGYLNKIIRHTERMASGKLTEPLKVKGNSPIAMHAKNLNELQEGVQKSVKEQAKSERLKTELITNVSHDLRTPLTSIITYTDLLKNPNLSAEEREKYVSILDQKAERLKVLIEDLFEVSKMASGNIELYKQKVDLAELLQQITGEQAGDFEAANLDLRVTIFEKPIYANVDGQKLWRVCENLLNNARKYSLTGTRVYVDLTKDEDMAKLSIKNVSKYELTGDVSELSERFKRADTARNTEGSGLGLAIATSIVQLHNGTLEISADGDLFKVTVSLPC